MPESGGLVFALREEPGGSVTRLSWPEIRVHRTDRGFLWMHLDIDGEDAERWIREESGLDLVFQDALLAEETRPRTAAHGDGLLLFLRGVNLNPGAEPDDMVSLRIWAESTRLLTLRRRRLVAVDEVRAQVEDGRVPCRAGDLVVAITNGIANHAGDVLDDVEDRADVLEDEVLTAESRELRTTISELRRTVIGLRRYLAPQREALSRLAGEPLSWLDDRQRQRLREVTDRTIRHVEELDAVREHAGVAHEELSGRLTERVERRMYVLSLVAAIFLPLSFLTGLLGINVAGVPGAEEPTAFILVVATCALVAVGLVLFFRRQGWL